MNTENHWNTLKICFFGESTKKPLRNFWALKILKIQAPLRTGVRPQLLYRTMWTKAKNDLNVYVVHLGLLWKTPLNKDITFLEKATFKNHPNTKANMKGYRNFYFYISGFLFSEYF